MDPKTVILAIKAAAAVLSAVVTLATTAAAVRNGAGEISFLGDKHLTFQCCFGRMNKVSVE